MSDNQDILATRSSMPSVQERFDEVSPLATLFFKVVLIVIAFISAATLSHYLQWEPVLLVRVVLFFMVALCTIKLFQTSSSILSPRDVAIISIFSL